MCIGLEHIFYSPLEYILGYGHNIKKYGLEYELWF